MLFTVKLISFVHKGLQLNLLYNSTVFLVPFGLLSLILNLFRTKWILVWIWIWKVVATVTSVIFVDSSSFLYFLFPVTCATLS